MKKQFLLIAALFCCHVYGQDTLISKSGSRIAVIILKETPSHVIIQKYDDTTGTARYCVSKRDLKGIHYQNNSISFASMSQPDFYSLGQKHAKEFGYPSDQLLNNADYLNGYKQKSGG